MTNENINNDEEADNLKTPAEHIEDIKNEAFLGCAKSRYLLGLACIAGDDIEKNTSHGLNWIILSANQEYQPAIDWLKILSEEYFDAKSSGARRAFKSGISKWELVVLAMSSISFVLWLVIISVAILER